MRFWLALCVVLAVAVGATAEWGGPTWPDVEGGESAVAAAGAGGPIPVPGMILVDYSYAWPNAKSGLADTNTDITCQFSTTGTYNIVDDATCAGASDCVTGQNWSAAGFDVGSVVTLSGFPTVDGDYTVDAVSTTELGLGSAAVTIESGDGDEYVISGGITDGICLSDTNVDDDSGEGGTNAFWKRAIFPDAHCDYVVSAAGLDTITCTLGGAEDHTINTFYCREDVAPFPVCPDELASVGYCVPTSSPSNPERAAPAVLYDPNIDRYINLEAVGTSSTVCQGIAPAFPAGASFLRDASYTSTVADLTDFEYSPALMDSEHFSRLGYLGMADWLARSAKWEFMYYPPDEYNLLLNGRAETDCSASGDWGSFDAGTGGAPTLTSTTFSHTASNLAFMGNGCAINAGARNDSGDALVIGPMDGLQRGFNDTSGGSADQYYACHMIVSGDRSSAGAESLRIEIVDTDNPATKMTMLAEASDPSHNGVNSFKVWSNSPPGAADTDGWTFWSGEGTTQASKNTPAATTSGATGMAVPIVITFEVESCDETAYDTCVEDDSGEEFEIRFWNTTAATAIWADEAFCYPTNFADNPLNLHDIFPAGIKASFFAASNGSEASTCTAGDNCQKMMWALKERFPVFGKSFSPSSRLGNLHAVNGSRLANMVGSNALGTAASDYQALLASENPDYVFMNLGQNDLDSSFPRTADEVYRDLTDVRAITARNGAVLIWLADPQTIGNTSAACSALGAETCGELWEDILLKLIDYDAQSQMGGVRLPVP